MVQDFPKDHRWWPWHRAHAEARNQQADEQSFAALISRFREDYKEAEHSSPPEHK